MRVVITGGAGFIGSSLALKLLETGSLKDRSGRQQTITELVIFDQVEPAGLPDDARLQVILGQADEMNMLRGVLKGADSVFHFASVVSGGAEADLELGLSVNLDGTRMILDILAQEPGTPRLVFASSLAVYGDGAAPIDDRTPTHPLSSYGVQKRCCELLIGDYSRRGLIDGVSMRFPTIAVRPGKANLANSSFISNIVREPAAGKKTICPVPEETEIALMSPGRLIAAIIMVHDLDAEKLGWPRALVLPAIKVSVGQMLEALEAELGQQARALVSFETDQKILEMVKGWPVNVTACRAAALGIKADKDAKEIVRDFLKKHSG